MKSLQDILRTQVEEVRVALGLTCLKFKYSTGAEFVDELIKLGKTKVKYPFFFVDSSTVEFNNDTVKIGKMIIATLTSPEYNSEQRETKTFGDILFPISEEFIKEIWISNRDIAVMKRGTVHAHYFFGNSGIYGIDGNVFSDAVDALELKNFQFRLSNN